MSGQEATTEELAGEDGADESVSSTIGKTGKSKEKHAKDKPKKKGLFRKLSKSDSKGESKKESKLKARGDTDMKELKTATGDHGNAEGSATVQDESGATEKPKHKKKSKFGLFKRNKKKKYKLAHVDDASPSAETSSQAPSVDDEKSSRPQSLDEADDPELGESENNEAETERKDEHHVVSMTIQLARPSLTRADATEQVETPSGVLVDTAGWFNGSKPTQSTELEADDTTGENPVGMQLEGETSGSLKHDEKKPEDVKTEAFIPEDEIPDREKSEDGENEEETSPDEHLSMPRSGERPDIVEEEDVPKVVVVLEEQIPEGEKESSEDNDVEEKLGGIKNGEVNTVEESAENKQESVAPKEEGLDEQAGEKIITTNDAGTVMSLIESLQDSSSKFQTEVQEDNEQETPREDEEDKGENYPEVLNPDENHEKQRREVELSDNSEEITAGKLEVIEENETNKTEAEIEVPVDETNKIEGEIEVPVDETNKIEGEIEVPVDETSKTEAEIEVPVDEINKTETEIEVAVDETNKTEAEIEVPVHETNKTEAEIEVPVHETNKTEAEIEVPVHETNKTEAEIEVPVDETNKTEIEVPATVTFGEDVQSEGPDATYLNLADNGEDKPLLRKRSGKDSTENRKNSIDKPLQTSVNFTKRRALFSMKNWTCCTIL